MHELKELEIGRTTVLFGEKQGKYPQGNSLPLTVHKVEGDTATLDFNHPLAGKTLVFDVRVLEIQ